MDRIRINTTLLHSTYRPVAVDKRLEDTKVVKMENGFAKIYVGDSKDGWVDSLREYFKLLTKKENEHIHTIKISYNSVRPKGERLKTFGGTASGHEPLKDMFEGIDNSLKNKIDNHLAPIIADEKGYAQVRPVHILDIGNLIGANVVVGGVRRTSEIFLSDADDWEVILAKYGINGIWDTVDPNDPSKIIISAEEKHNEVLSAIKNVLGTVPKWLEDFKLRDSNHRQLNHRRMSNNSIAFEKKPSRKMLNLVFAIMKNEGEPAFVNLEEARRRRPNAEGLNPCVEIILDSYGVCNLTTINMTKFVKKSNDGTSYLDIKGLTRAQELSTRIGIRMTLVELELPHWNKIQERDRLIGTSLTGWKDAMAMLNYNLEEEESVMRLLKGVSRVEADKHAKELRIASPLLATTVKPEGTLSQLAGGISSGLHMSHSPYYIRRVRINANDPLVKVARELDWTIHAEVGTNDLVDPKHLADENVINSADTLVIDFPVKSGATRTKDDVSVKEQFDTYFSFQEHYTEHNSSNTITVKPDEWDEAEEIVWNGWDDFVGVSFLPHDGGTYTLAPYESITEQEYIKAKEKMKPFDATLLQKYEKSETEADLEDMDGCEGGVCPIR